MQCARHPKVETALSCGKCGTPICPNCTIHGPVGLRCRDCASLKSSALYQVRPERFALAAVLGLAAGTFVGVLLQAISGMFLFFLLFIGPAIGGAVGEIILRASGRKRGLKLEILAGSSVLVGAVLSQVLFGHWRYLLHSPTSLVLYLVAVGLTASAAVGRIRYS
jgi:hypothetical protein